MLSVKFPRRNPFELSNEPSVMVGGTTMVVTLSLVVVSLPGVVVWRGAIKRIIKKTPSARPKKMTPIVFAVSPMPN